MLEYQRALSKSQDILNAKNSPEALQELTQAEAKAQKADLLESLEAKHKALIDGAKEKYKGLGNFGHSEDYAAYEGKLMDISSVNSRPEWLEELLERGNNFNKKHAFDYPYRELYLEAANGKMVRLDGYDDIAEEIISRKFTQLSEVKPETAFNYLRELANKYPSGAKIADVPSSGPLAGEIIFGRLILEVPIQNIPVPTKVLDKARELDIIIRDVGGLEY